MEKWFLHGILLCGGHGYKPKPCSGVASSFSPLSPGLGHMAMLMIFPRVRQFSWKSDLYRWNRRLLLLFRRVFVIPRYILPTLSSWRML